MVFSSNIFLFVFLPICLLGNFLLKKEYRNTFLLLCSLFFYFWGEPKHLWIIILSIVINYVSGLLINRFAGDKILKKFFLILSLLCNLGLLFYYKYFNFTIESFNSIVGSSIPLKNIALPIGISFFTFQGLTYVVDLYRGEVPVQKNILYIALYISLFPQLIAGPIVRYQTVYEEIKQRDETVNSFAYGIYRFAIGLTKKIIIANGVGYIADQIFNTPFSEHSVTTVWLGIICYSLQIYYDFSGYSDMAIGLGRMFGFTFRENFNLPYTATSITDFWRRWHISLSTFFRDYVYFPLGGSRKGNVYVNLFIVFILTGLWHGAAWTFVIWGLWHGFFRIAEKVAQKRGIAFEKVPSPVRRLLTLLIVMIGWVLFRAEDLSYALGYIQRLFGTGTVTKFYFSTGYYLDPYKIFIIGIAIVLSCFSWPQKLNTKICSSVIVRNCCTVLLLVISIIYVMNATYNPFIYFRF